MRRAYGAGPLHLLGLLATLAVAGYAALKVGSGPAALRTAVWFVGAVVLHDLVLFPLYAAADRALVATSRRAVTFVRVPLLLSGLLLLLMWPLITQHSEPALRAASGLSSDVFLGRWLLLTAALCAGSALLLLLTRRRA